MRNISSKVDDKAAFSVYDVLDIFIFLPLFFKVIIPFFYNFLVVYQRRLISCFQYGKAWPDYCNAVEEGHEDGFKIRKARIWIIPFQVNKRQKKLFCNDEQQNAHFHYDLLHPKFVKTCQRFLRSSVVDKGPDWGDRAEDDDVGDDENDPWVIVELVFFF